MPFTTFDPVYPNAFDTAAELKHPPRTSRNFTIAIPLQGLGANVTCRNSPSSPIPTGNDSVSCNENAPIPFFSPTLSMRAAHCNSTSAPGQEFDFHMRFSGAYVHTQSNGTKDNENITVREPSEIVE